MWFLDVLREKWGEGILEVCELFFCGGVEEGESGEVDGLGRVDRVGDGNGFALYVAGGGGYPRGGGRGGGDAVVSDVFDYGSCEQIHGVVEVGINFLLLHPPSTFFGGFVDES